MTAEVFRVSGEQVKASFRSASEWRLVVRKPDGRVVMDAPLVIPALVAIFAFPFAVILLLIFVFQNYTIIVERRSPATLS